MKIAIEIGDQEQEGLAYHNIGIGYSLLGEFDIAVSNFVSGVDVWNTLRSLLKSKGNWKMKFRDQHEMTHFLMDVIATNWKDQRGFGCC